jgi:MFS family permease
LAHYIGYGMIINLGEYSYTETVFAAILLGVGDAAFNCQLYSIVALFFQDEPTSAFSDYQVIIAAGNASPCIYYLFVTIPGRSIIYLVLMTLGLIGLTWCNLRVKEIDVQKKTHNLHLILIIICLDLRLFRSKIDDFGCNQINMQQIVCRSECTTCAILQ